MRLEGKVALVTGGAAGIGKATAARFAEEGAVVILCDVNADQGQRTARDIGAEFYQVNIADREAVQAWVDAVVAQHGRVDILVNNAGVLFTASVEETTLEQWRSLMAVNCDGVFLGTKHAIAAMKKKGGSIINLSSVAGMVGLANLGAYNASKGAVRLFTKAAALECAQASGRIRVNSIHPGGVWTSMLEQLIGKHGDEAADAAAVAMHPVGHAGEPDDIAYGVLYLASDESKFVTGAELVIDGGYTAQ